MSEDSAVATSAIQLVWRCSRQESHTLTDPSPPPQETVRLQGEVRFISLCLSGYAYDASSDGLVVFWAGKRGEFCWIDLAVE